MLDVGCGEGVVASLLRDVGCEVVGLDIDEESVAAMNKLGFKAHCCDLDADDPVEVLSGEMFDVIVCLDVLEHVKDGAGVLVRLKELLNPNGNVIISLPNIGHADVRLSLLSGRFKYADKGLLDATHLHFYNRESALELVESAGLEVADLFTIDVPLGATELGPASDVPDEAVEFVLSDPDSAVYQWIFRAHRPSEESRSSSLAYLVSQHFDLTTEFQRTQDHVGNLDDLLAAQTALAQDRGEEVARLQSEVEAGVEKARLLGEALDEIRSELALVTADLDEARQMVTDLTAARDVAVGERDVAASERDVAVGERDVALDERDLAIAAHDSAELELGVTRSAAASSAAELAAVRARIGFRVMDRLSRVGPVRWLVAVAAKTLRSLRSST